jgi:drug/metabolite transporter (DMT)-like permease
MTSETLTGAGLSLATAAVWGGGDFAGGIATRRTNVFKVVAGAHACGLLLMLLLVWITGETLPPRSTLLWGAAAGIAGAVGVAALYRGFAIGRMGIVAPVSAVITGVLPVLAGIYSEGMPAPIQLVGFVLALVSIWLIARPDGKIDTHRGLGLAVLAGVMFGLFFIACKQAGHHAVFWPLVTARTASTLLMLLIVALSVRDHRPLRPALAPVMFAGILDTSANALFIAATQRGRLDVTSVLSSLYPASTVILARIFLKERMSATQNAGIVGALISVALIAAH